MKTFVCLLLFLATSTALFGQLNKALLTTDLIFNRAALKELRFPAKAFRQEKSVRVFVQFTLTPEGEYHDVAIANSEPVDESFKEELDRVWRKLPKQDPAFAGRYVLPINFLFGDRSPEKLKPLSNETDAIVAKQGYKMLSALPVISYVLCEKRAFVE